MVRDFLKKTFKLADASAQPERPSELRPNSLVIKNLQKGTTGTEIYSGYFGEEYLHKLRGNKLAIEIDKMRRNDPQIKMLLTATKNPISAALYEMECPTKEGEEGYEEDKEITDLIEHILFNDSPVAFQKTIRQVCSVIDFGHAVVEKTFKTVFDHPVFGTYHGIAGLDLVSAKTISKWNINPRTRELESIEQEVNGDLESRTTLPREYFMLFNIDREGSNYEGISCLRPCYGNYFRKSYYLKLNAIGIERSAIKTPVIKIPAGMQDTPEFKLILKSIEIFGSGKANYFIAPEGMDANFEVNHYDPTKTESSIDKEDQRMSKAFLANFLELGMGTTGAYSLSNDLSDFFLSGLTYIADEIVDVFNNDLIPELVRLNFGPRARYPRLRYSGISDKAGKETAEILGLLIDKQVIVPDDALEDSLRAQYGFIARDGKGARKSAPAGFGAFSELRARVLRRVRGDE